MFWRHSYPALKRNILLTLAARVELVPFPFLDETFSTHLTPI